jgi:TatD DNase family protein
MKIVDTHCHYNMEPLRTNWQTHWQKAQENSVIGAVIVGTQISTSNLALTIAATQPNLLVAVGVHPTHANETTIEQLDEAAKTWTGKKIHAVGETGLDYYRLDRTKSDFDQLINQQKAILRWHIKFAQQQNVPLILHVRDKTDQAYWEVLEIIKNEYQGEKPFVLHCASGPLDYIKQAIGMGDYIGFDGNITYPKAQEIRNLVKSVPADRLMIETDAPFLAPQAYRGKPCEPWMITDTAKYVEKELKLDLNQIFKNTQQFFNNSFTFNKSFL